MRVSILGFLLVLLVGDWDLTLSDLLYVLLQFTLYSIIPVVYKSLIGSIKVRVFVSHENFRPYIGEGIRLRFWIKYIFHSFFTKVRLLRLVIDCYNF